MHSFLTMGIKFFLHFLQFWDSTGKYQIFWKSLECYTYFHGRFYIFINTEFVFCQNVKEKTVSLWSFVNDQQDRYLNPLYVHSVHQQHVLFPVASLRRIVPWTGYYLRWNPSMVPQVGFHLIALINTGRSWQLSVPVCH